jgi:hypothetical protein
MVEKPLRLKVDRKSKNQDRAATNPLIATHFNLIAPNALSQP